MTGEVEIGLPVGEPIGMVKLVLFSLSLLSSSSENNVLNLFLLLFNCSTRSPMSSRNRVNAFIGVRIKRIDSTRLLLPVGAKIFVKYLEV